MADKGNTAARGSRQESKLGRAPANLDAAARAKGRAGNAGYTGYEYQIKVTIWVALDLILAKVVTNELNIEPPSQEDLEATVHNPDKALLGLDAESDRIDFMFQAKTRSGTVWSAADLAKVLTSTQDERATKARKRMGPLEMLMADERRHYVFITNEALVKSLRVHEAQHFFDVPEATELPPHARKGYDPSAQAALAPRILLCGGVTEEVLEARIGRLLARHGHVPSVKHVGCLEDLKNEVRKRIRGHAEGRWTRPELVEVIARHGGSVAPTRAMDHYVRPRSFVRIREKLDRSHAVLIAGPSGIGKTLTADILEVELRRSDPPFDVVGEEYGPTHVRHHLMRTGPVLFHLRDPWGGNRLTPGADRWSGELPKLLSNASPEKKFLITSRSDVLQSAGNALIKDLHHYTVAIEVEDYGPARLQEIYDGIASDLTGHARSLAQAYREIALKSLSRPYEIDRFLVALSIEDANKPRKAHDIVADSQIDAISQVIAKQIEPWGEDGVASAAIIWALLAARGALARDMFPMLLRRIRSADSSVRPDVDGLLDFLVAGRNLRQDSAGLSFHHPRVEDGLRASFMRRPREAEHILSLVVDALAALDSGTQDWGIETGIAVLRVTLRLDGLELTLASATQERLDAHLESNAMTANSRLDFERALNDLARFGASSHLPSRLARVLVEGGSKPEQVTFMEQWRLPDLSDDEIDELRNDARPPHMIARFVREVLPFTSTHYDKTVAALLLELVPGIEATFWDALDTVTGLGDPSANIKAIVAGACAGASPDFDRAIARFGRSETETDAWMEKEYAEKKRQAEEHEVDATAADHILEEPQERYYNAQTGMEAVVTLRCALEGLAWIADHPHRQPLISAAAELIRQSRRVADPGELRLLLNKAEGWRRNKVWWAMKQHWQPDLADLLSVELAKSDLDSGLRVTLIEIAALNGNVDSGPVPLLTEVAHQVAPERQLELVYDLMRTTLDDDCGEVSLAARRAHAERLSDGLPNQLAELGHLLAAVMAGEEIRISAKALSHSARNHLSALLTNVSEDVAGPLLCSGATIGLDTIATARRLLATGDADHGEAAVQALAIDGRPAVNAVLHEAMTHECYLVRRKALEVLVRTGEWEDRNRVLAVAGDRSADVRLALARLMQEHKWPQAIDPLVKLLSDERDFSSDYGFIGGSSWSKFSVARAAAHALGAYDRLPASAVETLLEMAKEKLRDPFVACAAISALAGQDGDGISELIIAALESPGLEGAPRYRPRAQAAAWAVFDRAIAAKPVELSSAAIRMAREDRPEIAGPLLMASGVLDGRKRETLLSDLHKAGLAWRAELVKVAAAAFGATTGLFLEGSEPMIARLASGVPFSQLRPEERTELEEWSRGLDPDKDVQRFTAWVANAVFDLPVPKEVGDLRTLDLPEHIGVLTMRSLTSVREENMEPDDGM